jgi:hypothetical protein
MGYVSHVRYVSPMDVDNAIKYGTNTENEVNLIKSLDSVFVHGLMG